MTQCQVAGRYRGRGGRLHIETKAIVSGGRVIQRARWQITHTDKGHNVWWRGDTEGIMGKIT